MKISTDNLQNRPLVDFRWGFWGVILFDFLQNSSQNWAARIYATVGIALSVRELVRTGYGESGCGGGSVVGGLRVVLISTAAGMYDVRQLQLGSAAGSSPVWALLADRLLLRRCGRQGFWAVCMCRWGARTQDGGFSSATQSFWG